MIKQEDVDKAILNDAKRKLKICSDCKQKTLKVSSEYDFEGNREYWYRCVFCGYTNNSSWTTPIHGIFDEE